MNTYLKLLEQLYTWKTQFCFFFSWGSHWRNGLSVLRGWSLESQTLLFRGLRFQFPKALYFLHCFLHTRPSYPHPYSQEQIGLPCLEHVQYQLCLHTPWHTVAAGPQKHLTGFFGGKIILRRDMKREIFTCENQISLQNKISDLKYFLSRGKVQYLLGISETCWYLHKDVVLRWDIGMLCGDDVPADAANHCRWWFVVRKIRENGQRTSTWFQLFLFPSVLVINDVLTCRLT